MRTFVALSFGLSLMLGCRAAQIHDMARTTRIADSRFADEYTDAAETCLADSGNWTEYYDCMSEWEAAYSAMRALISTTLVLDTTNGRDEFRKVGCRWHRALVMVDSLSPVELPSVQVGIESRWRKRCK